MAELIEIIEDDLRIQKRNKNFACMLLVLFMCLSVFLGYRLIEKENEVDFFSSLIKNIEDQRNDLRDEKNDLQDKLTTSREKEGYSEYQYSEEFNASMMMYNINQTTIQGIYYYNESVVFVRYNDILMLGFAMDVLLNMDDNITNIRVYDKRFGHPMVYNGNLTRD